MTLGTEHSEGLDFYKGSTPFFIRGYENRIVVNNYLNSEKFIPGSASRYPQVRHHLDDVMDLIAVHFGKHKEPKRHREFLRTILLALVERYVHDPQSYVHYSRRREDFRRGSYYGKFHLGSYPIFIRVVDGLADAGLIENVSGFYDRTKGKGYSSRMRMTPQLVDILEMDPADPKQAIKSSDIWLRAGSDTTTSTRKHRDFLPHPQDVLYTKRKYILALINLANMQFKVMLNITPDEKVHLEARLGYPIGGIIKTDLWRVFNRADPVTRKMTTFGGRFYGYFQNIPREYRNRITFDGESATELDYDALHPTILYNKEGLPVPPGDLYATGLLPDDLESITKGTALRLRKMARPDPVRDVAKTLFLVAINAKTPTLALKASNSKLRQKFGVAFCHPPLEALLNALMTKHKPIAWAIASDAGIGLQYEDSCVAENILRTMAKKGIPCLPLHDSFIVPASKEDVLRQAMIEAYQSRYKYPPKISKKY